MERVERLSQAYSQAPWRKQLQFVGLFLLIMVFIALIASIYLNVSARSGAVGREIQDMQREILRNQREIAHLKGQLGTIYSSTDMERRARAMGFQERDPQDTLYIVVPDYMDRQPVVLAPSYQPEVIGAPVLPVEYTESFFVWLQKQFNHVIFPLFKVQS
jgi:cell division protein FtsL